MLDSNPVRKAEVADEQLLPAAIHQRPAAEGKTFVAGIGSGSRSRRASAAATASTAAESRPPEKLTRHGGRSSAGRIACSSASRGDLGRDGARPPATGIASRAAARDRTCPPCGERRYPQAMSSDVSTLAVTDPAGSARDIGVRTGSSSPTKPGVSRQSRADGAVTPMAIVRGSPCASSQRCRTRARSRQVGCCSAKQRGDALDGRRGQWGGAGRSMLPTSPRASARLAVRSARRAHHAARKLARSGGLLTTREARARTARRGTHRYRPLRLT